MAFPRIESHGFVSFDQMDVNPVADKRTKRAWFGGRKRELWELSPLKIRSKFAEQVCLGTELFVRSANL